MLLRVEALALLGYAVVLAVLVPPVLAGSAWPARSPRAALVLWQATGWGGGLSILSAGLTLAAADLAPHWAAGIAALPTGWSRLGPLGWGGVTLTVVAGAWLIAVLVASTVRVIRVRRAHRERLDLLTDEMIIRLEVGAEVASVRLLDHAGPAAYCLPGLRPQIVLSSGTVRALSTPQLAAVVVHERAHARGQHDLVIHPFRAWRETFAFLASARTAQRSVELLVEMLADDAARLHCGSEPLIGALECLSEDDMSPRVSRLRDPIPPLSRVRVMAVYATATVLVIAPPLLLALS